MTASDLYPTSLRLLGRPVLIVGGGRVAGRRVGALLDAGALVTVPLVIMVLLFQRRIISGLTAGGVTG